ncbi:hypothetical protein JXA88_00980 [Candidatus Fermentibacteria bacterium]|nr:hypothetical protein [Candidatus Fermentibacteria bacterium]
MPLLEKLGSFYLGREYDLAGSKRLETPIMYDARDMVTHGVCVGMTGSGKTGLCIDLLEEAAIDRVPAIIIDPKGDIGNLLLTFPDLRPEDFEPWLNVDDARRKGMTTGDYARTMAQTWSKGLAEWEQGPERIRLLKSSADFRIYTPGSEAGFPVSILASLKAPPLRWDDDAELLRDQIQGTVSALLGLAGMTVDPLQSREHILLSNIFEHFWRRNEDLDMARVITAIQTPPIRQLGVFDVDTFFPQKDRFGLALALNNIIAAPGFQSWLKGEPLDVASLLYDSHGNPRHSIFYIAHLSDAERMFFVTLLLEQMVTWVRTQAGTTSLRALLYFDEVFGFLPPTAMPPSKRPILTLLKQARAFGLGVLLCTQNPMDLDYKAMSNAGTWFIGKLQTDRDKARMLDGLESVSAEGGTRPDRATLDRLISGLGSRKFLLHNVHQPDPVVFETRWAMSYLRGPITRNQVRDLMAPLKTQNPDPVAAPALGMAGMTAPGSVQAAPSVGVSVPASAAALADHGRTAYTTNPPVLSKVPTVFLPLRVSATHAAGLSPGVVPAQASGALVYDPYLVVLASVGFVDSKALLNATQQVGVLLAGEDLVPIVQWPNAELVELEASGLATQPEPGALFCPVPSPLSTAAGVKALERTAAEYLAREQAIELWHSPTLKLYAQPGETEAQFRIRVGQIAREQRDTEVEKLRSGAETQIQRLEAQRERLGRSLAQDRERLSGRRSEELVSAGETVLGMLGLFGKRRRPALTRVATKRRMTSTAKAAVEESEQAIRRLRQDIDDLQRTLQDQADDVARKWSDASNLIETYVVRPKKTNVRITLAALAWVPSWEFSGAQGATQRVPGWR